MSELNAANDPLPIYLDQNILSHLRESASARDELIGMFRKLGERSAVFVYSMTHVDECRESSQPETFAHVLEELPVYLIEFQQASDPKSTLSLGRAHELLLESVDTTHQATRLIEGLLNLIHFAAGWLGDTEIQAIRDEMAAELRDFWANFLSGHDWELLGTEVEAQVRRAATSALDELALVIEKLPFEQTREGWKHSVTQLRERLPASFAQLDDVPEEQVVSFVFSCLEEHDSVAIQNQFPKGFWSKFESRKSGDIAGLAFILFLCGLVRDSRVKNGANDSRIKHFRGQFRDGVHIENAARCAVFITCDLGAARLARSVYAYAGVETTVVVLKVNGSSDRAILEWLV